MMTQVVFDTSKILSMKGVRHVVLSPGSRNAPLTISFARNPDIQVYNIVDERSAAFIALGIAQKLQQPVALCCTSGTSLLNYAPAIAEAFYQQIPLIVLSADRPPEWLDQRDGQTINQQGALANFVKEAFQMPASTAHPDEAWEYERKLNEAVNLAQLSPQGPVHLNMPFREPFYPEDSDSLKFSDQPRVIEPIIGRRQTDIDHLVDAWRTFDKRLIVCGQGVSDVALKIILEQLEGAVIVADVIANVSTEGVISHHDLFLAGIDEELADSLRPDFLITFGKSVISKNLKIFLKKHQPSAHWHIDEAMQHADTFQSMTTIVQCSPADFFSALQEQPHEVPEFNQQVSHNFVQNWQVEQQKIVRKLPEVIQKTPFCEFKAFYEVMKDLPDAIDLHLANSMPVRLANFIQNLKGDVEVFCNRGTSGIDGTNGTAVGNALVSDRPTWLLTGDLSFFYDRNAFFHPYGLNHLKIIVFNNMGGGIFRLIAGPSALPELEQHFETRHNHSARFTAVEYGLDYYKAGDEESIQKALKQMTKKDTPSLLEIFTDPDTNQKEFASIKKALKK